MILALMDDCTTQGTGLKGESSFIILILSYYATAAILCCVIQWVLLTAEITNTQHGHLQLISGLSNSDIKDSYTINMQGVYGPIIWNWEPEKQSSIMIIFGSLVKHLILLSWLFCLAIIPGHNAAFMLNDPQTWPGNQFHLSLHCTQSLQWLSHILILSRSCNKFKLLLICLILPTDLILILIYCSGLNLKLEVRIIFMKP